MAILKIEHRDFRLTVECPTVMAAYQKAQKRQPGIAGATRYSWSDGVETVELRHPETDTMESIQPNEDLPPVFFENKDYIFFVEFKEHVSGPSVYSRLREVSEKFYHSESRRILSGTLNFGNDLGKADFILRYLCSGKLQEFRFHFEVFPTKLNFRQDYDRIIQDIESEYPHLVLDFLRKTHKAFKEGNRSNNDLVWWAIFGGLFEELSKATQIILSRPHSRLVREQYHVRPERIRQLTPALEEELERYSEESHRRYRIEQKTLSIDTPENRFLKYALKQLLVRYRSIREKIVGKYAKSISKEFRAEMDVLERRLQQYVYHPMFRAVGDFKGLRQESLVLQKATGYSTVMRCWLILQKGLGFWDGLQEIEMKNIAELYQIWCFLEMKKMLEEILGEPKHKQIGEVMIDGLFTKLREGRKSRITFFTDQNEKVELFHEYQYSRATDSNQSKVVSYTVVQRPDFVLQIHKGIPAESYLFTYLFDAKYRLLSDDDDNASDLPPDDAINQMHRYRDAIYYKDIQRVRPAKEVIGGYILFPATGTKEQVEAAYYSQSIRTVNIGAFPLLPGDQYETRQLLKDFLEGLLNQLPSGVMEEVAPQKHMQYEVPGGIVLIGTVRQGAQEAFFLKEGGLIYHTPNNPRKFALEKIRYFAPHFKNRGVRDIYEIVSFERKMRNSIFPKDSVLYESNEKSYTVLHLKLIKRLDRFVTIESIRVLTYTTFDRILESLRSEQAVENIGSENEE
jgi:predicted component of viral defense system (DUF524 family)